ncbi:hypothetical protein INT80_06760 [Gallibacterium anatis]|uniref:Uncharacterized protein n=1 Tax=Gallibacterium anatis TaxID=750 RepID=A0A930UTV2_9PAST|nr:hypothetical protein [Gallibacterium anatis]
MGLQDSLLKIFITHRKAKKHRLQEALERLQNGSFSRFTACGGGGNYD